MFPSLGESKHLNQYSRLKCSKEEKLISFDHSITLTGIRVFFKNTVEKPSIEFKCHLNNHESTVEVCFNKFTSYIYKFYIY